MEFLLSDATANGYVDALAPSPGSAGVAEAAHLGGNAHLVLLKEKHQTQGVKSQAGHPRAAPHHETR